MVCRLWTETLFVPTLGHGPRALQTHRGVHAGVVRTVTVLQTPRVDYVDAVCEVRPLATCIP